MRESCASGCLITRYTLVCPASFSCRSPSSLISVRAVPQLSPFSPPVRVLLLLTITGFPARRFPHSRVRQSGGVWQRIGDRIVVTGFKFGGPQS
jgi:hypothetical protein